MLNVIVVIFLLELRLQPCLHTKSKNFTHIVREWSTSL